MQNLELNKLEDEFEKLCQELTNIKNQAQSEINEKLAIAVKALREAELISEKTSIPFPTPISFIDNEYVPRSLKNSEFMKKLEPEVIQEICGVGGDLDYGGWEHSAIC